MGATASRPLPGRLARRILGAGGMFAALLVPVYGGQELPVAPPRAEAMTFQDAKPTFDVLHQDWPEDLRGLSPSRLEAAWPEWVRKRDAVIRSRLDRGDEDSVVNLWLYGTTFTDLPPLWQTADARPLTDQAVHREGAETSAQLSRRLEDLLRAMNVPGPDERLIFARELFERRGINLDTAHGQARVRAVLTDALERGLAEHRIHESRIRSAQQSRDPGEAIAVHSTLFQDRGLSSDTSMLIGFAIECALEDMKKAGTLRGPVTHAGIVGPGLDVINKADGHDFYPVQSLQPFALADSLVRLGLADAGQLRITTFDVNPHVNGHLERARVHALRGEGYTLHATLSATEAWRPELLRYWDDFGDRIGGDTTASRQRADSHSSRVRAIHVRPEHVASIQPLGLNIVLERVANREAWDGLDLLVATNVLVYYDRFEQSLAVANAAAMLRPGGVLITNNAVLPVPPLKDTAHHRFVSYTPGVGEHVFRYQRD